MSDKKKPVVDITNRPSERDRHNRDEWRGHLEVTEAADTRRDIREARSKLAKLTVRAFAETFCYDDREVCEFILGQIDGNELIGNIKVDERALRKLADKVGGERAHAIVENSHLREIEDDIATPSPPPIDISEQQVELLRALIRTMDPEVVKKAFTGE